jgi:hypothetical protein
MVSDRMLVNVLISYKIYWRNFGFSNYVERMNEQTNASLAVDDRMLANVC